MPAASVVAHGLESGLFHEAAVFKPLLPLCFIQPLPIQQGKERLVVESGGAVQPGVPLGIQLQEEADDRPVFRPYFCRFDVIRPGKARGGQLFIAGQRGVEDPGGFLQFPSRSPRQVSP